MHASIHPYIHTSIHPYIHPSIHPSIQPSVYASIHPYIHTRIHTCIQHNLFIYNLLVLTLPRTTCSTPILHHLFSFSCFPHAIFAFLVLLVGRKLTCGVIWSFNFHAGNRSDWQTPARREEKIVMNMIEDP